MEQVHSDFRCNRPFDPRWHDKDVANIYVMPLTVEYDRAHSVKDLKDRRSNIAARQCLRPRPQTVKLTPDGGHHIPTCCWICESQGRVPGTDRGGETFILERKLFA
jgi:hypothetical protein